MFLGLGSRANTPKRPPPSAVRVPQTAPPSTHTTSSDYSSRRSDSPSRRGFGLFFDSDDDEGVDADDDDENEDSEMSQSVKFSGDVSGFAVLRQQDSAALVGQRSGNTPGSHRRLATPKSARAERRGTPYSTSTTGRALMRAKQALERSEDPTMRESIFANAPVAGGSSDETDEEELQSNKQVRTPSTTLFQTSPPRKTMPKSEPTTPNGDKTWGQWIQNFVPESVKKPIAKVLDITTPRRSPKKDIFLKTPEAQVRTIESLPMPGSFEKPEGMKKDKSFINPNFIAQDKHQTTPIPDPKLFLYDHSVTPSASRYDRYGSTFTPPVHPASSAFRRPSNFISRMRSVKKPHYNPYSPYARGTPKPVEKKDLTPAEELALLEQRERDRKVQEREDKYLRRETLRKLGQPVDDDDEMDDAATAPPAITPKKSKGKGRAATVEDTDDLDAASTRSTTPPSTPPKSATKVTPKASSTPRGPLLFEPTPPSPSPNPFATVETDSDKENTQSPPPPPIMSHRQLPVSTAPSASIPESGLGLGFGFADRQRSLLDKHKPRVSSSLRESSTYAKENDDDAKENATGGNGEGSSASAGMFKSGVGGAKVFGGQPILPTVKSTAGALKEVGTNAVGAGVKVDVGARIAQLASADLFTKILFPAVTVPGSNDLAVMKAIENSWTPQGIAKEWGNGVFAGIKSVSVRAV